MKYIVDIGERIFLVLLCVPFVIRLYYAAPDNPTAILIGVSEFLAIFFILIRKPGEIATTPYPLAIAFVGSAMPLLITPAGETLAPLGLTSGMVLIGLGINISAKLSLNRSFGLVAANRGVKVGGAYRFVRHPMYLGYFVAQVGFLLSAFSWTNLAIYIAAWCAQVLRIVEEEKFLSQDPEYRAFMKRVPRRVLPGF